MLENPDLFYKMNKMSLKEHREVLNQDVDRGKSQENVVSLVPPSYYKKIKIYKMNLYVTLKSDYFYGLAVKTKSSRIVRT